MQNFNYDVKLAVNVNGNEQTFLPEDDYDVNNPDDKKIYYKVNVTCDNQVEAEWDYNAWNLKITKLDNDQAVNGTKCKLAFNNTDANGLLGMSATERDNIIKQGVQIRRNTYRGKDITEYFTDGTLYSQISSGKFDDIYVGDYIISEHNNAFNGKIVWLIADLDNYWNQGDTTALTKHHATIIPAYKLQDSRMNPTASAAKGASQVEGAEEFGAYKGSEMYQVILNTVLSKYIEPDFCKFDSDCHIVEYQSLLSNDMEAAGSNQYGSDSGASSNWAWESRKLDLMSEVNVYGTTVWSSSGFDVGIDNRQYAIFQLRPELINQGVSGIPNTNSIKYGYWLKAVTSSTHFAYVDISGGAGTGVASIWYGVRPRFLID